jgi:hypothetical protein
MFGPGPRVGAIGRSLLLGSDQLEARYLIALPMEPEVHRESGTVWKLSAW